MELSNELKKIKSVQRNSQEFLTGLETIKSKFYKAFNNKEYNEAYATLRRVKLFQTGISQL